MQVAVCIESISAPYRPSLHTQCTLGWDYVFRTCIVHSVRLFFWPLLPILGECLHSAPASCIGTLSALSWLWVSFCIPHSASCILHVSHRSCRSSFWARFCILHSASASCIGCSS